MWLVGDVVFLNDGVEWFLRWNAQFCHWDKKWSVRCPSVNRAFPTSGWLTARQRPGVVRKHQTGRSETQKWTRVTSVTKVNCGNQKNSDATGSFKVLQTFSHLFVVVSLIWGQFYLSAKAVDVQSRRSDDAFMSSPIHSVNKPSGFKDPDENTHTDVGCVFSRELTSELIRFEICG